MKVCVVNECGRAVHARGYCRKHYERWKKSGDPSVVNQIKGDDKARLLSKVDSAENGCWIWKGAIKSDGYGGFGLKGKIERAHRAAWKIFKGEIPRSKQLNHKCHNRKCVNPDHLYIGTPTENMADMDAANRRNPLLGQLHQNSKVTDDLVRAIRVDKRPQATIAAEYGIAQSTVGSIKRRETWKHVE